MDQEKNESSTSDLVTEVSRKERELFEQAFTLAYFIHANKEIAFFIAEDAVEGLTSLLTYQKKNRAPAERLRGFWKWGERTRPIRKTLILDEHQMLQWLVYKQSEYWERQTEENAGFYTPSAEDLIVRYIEHLVFLTARRGSFYVTLAICSLLHQFDRRETRFFYDVLTQSDAARMKDTGYIGKQRLELLDKVLRRFEGVVKTVNKSASDRQLLKQPVTESITHLVKESLRRFTPWGTTCVLNNGFDVTDIPALFYSETTSNEDDENLIEMNRIHIVLHPECLDRFAIELEKYVRSLPEGDLDAGCDFESLEERITVPQFNTGKDEPPRQNRYETPKLRVEDYVRLRRTLDARGHRKKSFVPQTLSVYADGGWSYSFEPKNGKGQCVISAETSLIEVRGKDSAGEVPLAMLIRGPAQTYDEFEGSIIHAGGQKISLRTRRCQNVNESESGIELEVDYKQNSGVVDGLKELLGWSKRLVTPTNVSNRSEQISGVTAFAKVVIAIAGIGVVGLLFWWSQFKTDTRPEITEKALPSPSADHSPQTTASSTPIVETEITPPTQTDNAHFAQARWSTDENAALHAVSLERTRASQTPQEMLPRRTRTIIGLPLFGSDGRTYSKYRTTLASSNKPLWRKTLSTPEKSLTGYTHVLEVILFTSRLPKNDFYDLEVEGLIGEKWYSLGKVKFSRPRS